MELQFAKVGGLFRWIQHTQLSPTNASPLVPAENGIMLARTMVISFFNRANMDMEIFSFEKKGFLYAIPRQFLYITVLYR